MPYLTGAASTPELLVGAIAAFAQSNGWTVTTVNGGGRVLAKAGAFVALWWSTTSVFTAGCTGADAGQAASAQPGISNAIECNTGGGPFVSHTLYSSAEDGGELLLAVVEVSAGQYRHITAGTLIKFGSGWTGGAFVDATYWRGGPQVAGQPGHPGHRFLFDDSWFYGAEGYGVVRADIDGKPAPYWFRFHSQGQAGTTAIGDARGHGLHGALYAGIGHQRYNLNTPLFPIVVLADRPGELRSAIGRVPHLRRCNLRLLFPGQVLDIGGEEWQVWPECVRTDAPTSADEPRSHWYGFAVRRVA